MARCFGAFGGEFFFSSGARDNPEDIRQVAGTL